jgi:hypothetical protein
VSVATRRSSRREAVAFDDGVTNASGDSRVCPTPEIVRWAYFAVNFVA